MSCGLKLRVKITVPRTIGGMLVGHRLAEHVAERQQVHEAQRVKRPRVPAVLQRPPARPGRCSRARCGGG